MAFALISPAFVDGNAIPREFTCDGNDAPPPLLIRDPPAGAASFAVIMDDPDAPGGLFTHWIAYDIPVHGDELETTAGKTLRNDFGRQEYGGPCPPHRDGAHRYHVTVYALDVPSLDLPGDTRDGLQAAIKGHTLGMARMMGRYERSTVGATHGHSV
jgi:Raf kinase inhibitor-like YbhB/YbcL family protein